MKLDVFGKYVEVIRRKDEWRVFYLSNEVKKRDALDIKIPPEVAESEVIEYISDLCHEWASAKNNRVKKL